MTAREWKIMAAVAVISCFVILIPAILLGLSFTPALIMFVSFIIFGIGSFIRAKYLQGQEKKK